MAETKHSGSYLAVIHGHTYLVQNLDIDIGEHHGGMSIDFGIIKGYFKKTWHHKFFLPKHLETFKGDLVELLNSMKINTDNIRFIKGTTAEDMALIIQEDIKSLCRVHGCTCHSVSFMFYEGPGQSAVV